MEAFGRDFDNDDEMDEYIDWLIEVGILVEDGFDEDGDETYTYDFERMKEINPELYDAVMAGINENLMHLYEAGLVKVEYDEELRAHFSATEEGKLFFDKIHKEE